MRQKNDELMALADVFAEALLSAASDRADQEAIAAEFKDLMEAMAADAGLKGFLTSETIDDEARREALEKFRGRMHEFLLNLLHVLNNRGRMALLPLIWRAVELRIEALHHQKEVRVETARPLTDELRSAIRERVGAYIGKEALLIEEVNPALIGGLIIRVDDRQIDASVASRLRIMRRRLDERSEQEIHAGRGFEVDLAQGR